MTGAPDPNWYFEHVLADARPGGPDKVVRGPVSEWRRWWRRQAATNDPAIALAAARGFVLTIAEAATLGRARSQRRTAVRRGEWTSAGRGLLAPVDITTELPRHGADAVRARRAHTLEAAGAVLVRPRDAMAGRSAAIAHGLPTFAVPSDPELLAVGSVGVGNRPSSHLYSAALRAEETTTWFGARVTTPARTLVDLGRHDRRDAIMAADAALRERLVTVADVNAALLGARGWPGVRRARAVLALADPSAESPLESYTRLRVHDAGLPEPVLQATIGPYRTDFYWPKYRFVLEADGRLKYTDDERWQEKRREQYLRRDGNRVERVTWPDVLGGWPDTVAMLRAALR